MVGIRRKKIGILELEKRMMFDASLAGLITSTVIGEDVSNAAPAVIDGDVTITGTTLDFNGETFHVTSTGLAQDDLSIRNEGTGAGQIGFDGTNITFGGTQIGTIVSDGQDGTDLIINFDNTTTKAAIERLIENVTYQNTSDNPTTTHNLNFSLDGYFSQGVSITIVPQNEAPDVTNNGISLNEGGTQTIDATALGITDPDNIDSDVVVSVTSAPLRGQLELTTNAGVAISSFTLDDINNNRVIYIHGGSETTTNSFDFTVSDGTAATATDTFDISITPVNDPLSIDINTGTTVFQSFTTSIGGVEGPGQFGTEVFRRSGVGEYGNMQAPLDNQSSQISLIFTTPAVASTSNPGQVIFESGGSGVGIGLYLDANNSLGFYISNATSTPRLSSTPLATSTQYAVVIEIDQVTDEVRMSYQQANDFDWFNIERAPEATLTGYTATDHVGSNNSGYGVLGAGSYGGFNGSASGPSTFQGTIDSDLVITRMPVGPSYINTQLVVNDVDTLDTNIIYTITTDATDGELYLNGVLIGLGDTFTQEDLDQALVTYTHGGAIDPSDSFTFDVTDGTTTLSGTYNITVDTNNTAPVITPAQTFDVFEDASNSDSLGYLDADDAEIGAGQVLTYSITGGTGNGIFTIDSATGQITVADNTTLDYETTTSYTLTIQVTDNGPGLLSDTDTITINVIDVNEAPIIAAGGPFNIDENSANNTVVGTVSATDTVGETLSYSIVGGNTNNAFKINSVTGVIQVRDTNFIDYETQTSFTLRVRATDDNASPLYAERNFTVTLNDLNEAPSFNDADIIYAIDQNAQYSSATGNWYRYYNNNVSITTALANAESAMLNGAAGHLVTITSAAENTFVDNILGNHIWIAASDIDNEGSWLWIAGPEAGTQFSQGGTAVGGAYERWAGSEPNTTANDYAIMNTNGQWYDEANGNSRRYVVEWERDDVLNNSYYTVSHNNTDGSDIANGTSVGSVQAADADAGNTLNYTIEAGNADGIFQINTSTGEITILDNTNLDPSVLDTYVLTIRATEIGGAGLFDEIDITVNFSETFSITANNPVTTNEGGNVAITTTELNIADGDTAATDIIISVTDTPDNGFLALTSAPAVAINNFTLDDIQNGLVTYVNNGSENTSDSFTFSVTDGATVVSGQTFSINITPVNDAPTINVNTGTTVVEGGTRVVTAAMLNSLDQDDADTDLDYTASNLLNGTIEVNGVVQNTFTQDDINNNRVVFRHDGNEGNGRFDVVLADGGEDLAGTASATFTLTKTAVNDAPIITTNTGIDVVEGSTVTITTTQLNVTDPDDSGTGLTYTLSNVVNGQVELSTNPNVPIIWNISRLR